ncbi:glucosyltransferase domain-containing protein [Aurantimonas coralicida]|uniref:glucosyltransferase domain-containing protein n=1 Tax=Aurantimonas coralicida TaxID=182270 RepID=UPI000A5F3366|nr:glucosyltransferase domain-containing protein [Aurantimonas coralicida]
MMNEDRARLSVSGLWLIAFGVLALSFWQSLGSFVPTADNETIPSGIVPVVLSQGRLTSYALLSILAPAGNIHPLDLLIGLTGFASATVVALRVWGLDKGPSAIAGALVAASFPTTVHMFTFSTVNMVFGIGMLIAASAVWFFASGRFVLSALLVLATIGTYQGLLANVVVIFLVWQAVGLMRGERTVSAALKGSLAFLALIAVCALVYSATVSALLSALGIRLQLVNDILRPDLLINSFWQMVTAAGGFLWAIITGQDVLFVDRGTFVGALQIALLAAAVGAIFRRGGWSLRTVLAILFLLAAVGAPFLSIAITGGAVRYRSLMSAPFAMAGMAAVAACWDARWARKAVLAASALLALFYVQATMQVIRGASLSWQDDQHLANRIMERVAAIDPTILTPGQKTGFEMVGWYDRRSEWIPNIGPRTTLGYSFFRYSESPSRAVGAFQIMGHPFFRPATNAERLQIAERAGAMPVWPAPGSVQVIDGVVVVKFHERYTNFQLSRYCPTQPADECRDTLALASGGVR